MDEILSQIASSVNILGTELSPNEIQVILSRLRFIWGSTPTTGTTKWRHKKSREAYDMILDLDCHLFLSVVLSINPTQIRQTSFRPVLAHLRQLGQYDTYNFTPTESTKTALQTLAEHDAIATNGRYRHLVEVLTQGSSIGAPVIEFAFSNLPIHNISVMPGLIVDALKASMKYTMEEMTGAQTTDCVQIFIRPNGADGSIVINCGCRALHAIRSELNMS